MNVEKYRGWFVAGSLALMLLAASPALAWYVHLPSGSERFSELWLLGPTHRAEDYPFSARVNETYSVYVGVGNHLGYSAYYRIFVKFRNQTQPLPTASDATPSPLPTLYEYDFFVRDSQIWETLLNFKILDTESLNNYLIVKNLSINDVPIRSDGFLAWDNVTNGFYYQLFLELWLYSVTSQTFLYHNRFVGIWLNVTSSA